MEASDASYQHWGLVHGSDQASHGHFIGLLGLQVKVGIPGDQEAGRLGWLAWSEGLGLTLALPTPARCLS